MILFTKARWKNFLSYGNVWSEIDISSHKNTLIMGTNGSGKSTFLDVLTFGLFGKPFRKVNKGGVINSINNKNCLIEIEFSIGNKNYKIVRGIKPTIFEIICDGNLINQDASSRDYQDYLEKNILRMNYKSFTQIVILGSASFTPFMLLSAADRRAVIEELLDLKVFSAMSSIVKNKLQINRDSIEKNKILLNSKEDNKSYIEKTLKLIRTNNEEKLRELYVKKQEIENQLKIEQDDVNEKQKNLDKALEQNLDISAFKTKHSKLLTLKAKIESNRKRNVTEQIFFRENDTCPTCKQTIDESFKEERFVELEGKIDELDKGLNSITEQINIVLREIEKIDDVLRNINKIKMDLMSSTSAYNNTFNTLQQIIKQIDNMSVSDKTIQDSERQLSEIKHDISSLEEEKKILLDERQYIDTAIILLKDEGIKSKIVKQYLPIINKYINKYLSDFNFFVNFNINENFEESIKSRFRDEFSYNNFSEGEKLRINISLLLTWREIAKLKNSVNTNLLIFDEIFDNSLDQEGMDNMVTLLNNLGDKTNVFVISHNNDMTDKFQRTLRFKKVNNFSVIDND